MAQKEWKLAPASIFKYERVKVLKVKKSIFYGNSNLLIFLKLSKNNSSRTFFARNLPRSWNDVKSSSKLDIAFKVTPMVII